MLEGTGFELIQAAGFFDHGPIDAVPAFGLTRTLVVPLVPIV
jgi:hypothetical protein